MKNIEQDYEDFISTVSHELRTPLTSIRGFSQTMLSSWDKLDDESKKKFLKIIEEQSNRLIHLVENMLSVTKLQGINNHFVFNELSVRPAIEQAIAIIKNQYPNQIFELTHNQNVPNIYVDKDKFQQILTNLIENSAKYSAQIFKTLITTEINNGFIEIKFSNIGIGIAQEDYQKIFTKFARIDNPLTRKIQGSGLGLYITKSLVEKMKGEIFVESTPLENNNELAQITFTLRFPILNIEEQARMKCNQ